MKFYELTQDVKDRVLTWHADTLDGSWYKYVTEQAKYDGKALGFEMDNIYFSGFWSQGDGASWVGTVDISLFIDAHTTKPDPRWEMVKFLISEGALSSTCDIYVVGYYSHDSTMCISNIQLYDLDYISSNVKYPLFDNLNRQELWNSVEGDALLEMLEDWMLYKARDYAQKVYESLYQEYEYQTGEAYVAETAEANEWDFDEEGNLI